MPDTRAVHPVHPVSRRHLDALSDEIGIMQHAIGAIPDPAHGYCTDDVARALQVDLLHARELGWVAVSESAWRNLRFIEEAFDEASGRFRNFRLADGSWRKGEGSDDCQGRAVLALGEVIGSAPDGEMAARAATLLEQALPVAEGMAALRGRASVMLGCGAAMQGAPTARVAAAYRSLARGLQSTFQSRPAQPWPWPESRLTYENALPVRALIQAGVYLESRPTTDAGLRLLDWLIKAQTGPTGHLSPIGNGWWPRGGQMSHYDQQPIEPTSLLLAAEAAYEATGSTHYRATMERAYGWFLGANDRGLRMADPGRGACFDGLTPSGVNHNQGAESTLMWLIALEHVRAFRGEAPPASPSGRPVLVAAIR